MKFKIKKHPYYLYISFCLVLLFFIMYSIISNKITATTAILNDYVIQRNIKAKYLTFKFEFEKLYSFSEEAEKLLRNSNDFSENKLYQKLYFLAELATSNENIDNGFIFFLNENSFKKEGFFGNFSENSKKEIKALIKNNLHNPDTIFSINNEVYNRKITSIRLKNNTKVIFGYDVNLLKYRERFSQNQFLDGSYIILTNKNGTCLLHPNANYIGKKVQTFFKETSPQEIIELGKHNKDSKINLNELIQSKTVSEFLNLEVLRYFKTIKIYDKDVLILMVNFPVDISLKASIVDVKKYFLWMSFLALCTFMLLLAIARLQLRKEFSEKLKSEKEKEKLAIANEKIKQENTVLQLNQLKKKMHPHFLFNSLNSLLVLIEIDTELSQKFTLKLAEVYRYLLDDRNDNLITVKEELNFLEHYFFLHKIRFKDSLHLKITNTCIDKCLQKRIPFLSLETVIENAIKHNEITKQKPLFIEVLINDDFVIVTNNYNPRKTKQKNSYNFGLNYLSNSYQYYDINTFKTEISNKKFNCYLPLLP